MFGFSKSQGKPPKPCRLVLWIQIVPQSLMISCTVGSIVTLVSQAQLLSISARSYLLSGIQIDLRIYCTRIRRSYCHTFLTFSLRTEYSRNPATAFSIHSRVQEPFSLKPRYATDRDLGPKPIHSLASSVAQRLFTLMPPSIAKSLKTCWPVLTVQTRLPTTCPMSLISITGIPRMLSVSFKLFGYESTNWNHRLSVTLFVCAFLPVPERLVLLTRESAFL